MLYLLSELSKMQGLLLVQMVYRNFASNCSRIRPIVFRRIVVTKSTHPYLCTKKHDTV